MGKSIGLIGLGAVGSKIATSLLETGTELHVFDIEHTAVSRSAEGGAIPHASSRDLASLVDTVVLSLPNSDVVDAVTGGDDGILSVMKEGSTLVDMSTSLPARTLALAEGASLHSVRVLDAPMTFGPRGMVVFVGGDERVYEELTDLFDAISFRHIYVGPQGHGHYVKLIQNMLAGVHSGAVAEAIGFAEHAGIDMDSLQRALRWTGVYSKSLDGSMQRMISRDFGTSGTLPMHLKDMNYAVETGKVLGARTPFTSLIRDVDKQVLQDGDAVWGETAVVRWFEPSIADASTKSS